jgi:phospholipase C
VVADLRERGLHPEGLTSRVLAVERSEWQGEQVRVQVVDQRSAYALVDDRGSVVQSVPEAGLTRWTVTLAQEPADPLGWRVVDVTAS